MLHPRVVVVVVVVGGVVDPVRGGEEAVVEGEAPIVTTLAKPVMATEEVGEEEEEGLAATPTIPREVGVAAMAEVVGVAGEEEVATEDHNKAMGKLQPNNCECGVL